MLNLCFSLDRWPAREFYLNVQEELALSQAKHTQTHNDFCPETEMLFLCMKFDSLGEKHAHKRSKGPA